MHGQQNVKPEDTTSIPDIIVFFVKRVNFYRTTSYNGELCMSV